MSGDCVVNNNILSAVAAKIEEKNKRKCIDFQELTRPSHLHHNFSLHAGSREMWTEPPNPKHIFPLLWTAELSGAQNSWSQIKLFHCPSFSTVENRWPEPPCIAVLEEDESLTTWQEHAVLQAGDTLHVPRLQTGEWLEVLKQQLNDCRLEIFITEPG